MPLSLFDLVTYLMVVCLCGWPYCLTLWLTLWLFDQPFLTLLFDLVTDLIVLPCDWPYGCFTMWLISCMTLRMTFFSPVCWQLKEDYREDYRRRGHPIQRTEAIDELKNAFDLAERSCSGITDDLLTGVIGRLATTARVQEVDIRRAVDKVKR